MTTTSVNRSSTIDLRMDPLQLLDESRFLMRITLVPNAIIIPTGALSAMLNLLTVIIIVWSKKLRNTKCFVLLAANSTADFLIGLSYCSTASVRVFRHRTSVGEVMSMWRCSQELVFVIVAQVFSLGTNTALVTERILATFCTLRYKTWTFRRVTIPLIVAACLFAFVQLAAHIHDSWMGRQRMLITCGIEDTVSDRTLEILTAIQMITSGIVVVLHCVLAYGVRRQKRRFRSKLATVAASSSSSPMEKASNSAATTAREMAKLEADAKFVRAITAIVITHILVIGARFTIFLLNSRADKPITRILANRYCGLVVVLGSMVDFFLLLMMSSQFRDATKKFLRMHTANSVSVILLER